MSRKFPRLVLLAMLAAGFALAPSGSAFAAGGGGGSQRADWFVNDFSPDNPGAANTGFNDPTLNSHDIAPGITMFWTVKSGKHNITPVNDKQGGMSWGNQKPSDDLTPDSDAFSVKFSTPGKYYFISTVNGEGTDDHGQLGGMWGVVNVKDTTTTAPPPPPPTTTTTEAPTTTTAPPPSTATTATTAPAVVGPAATHTPSTAAPATTTTAKPEKDKNNKDKKDDTTTTTAPPPPATAGDIPAEAIVPNVTPDGSATQNGVVEPSSTPSGDAIATLKEKHGKKGVKLLIVTGIGIGALGIGAAGYKYANRSSKYFPA